MDEQEGVEGCVAGRLRIREELDGKRLRTNLRDHDPVFLLHMLPSLLGTGRALASPS